MRFHHSLLFLLVALQRTRASNGRNKEWLALSIYSACAMFLYFVVALVAFYRGTSKWKLREKKNQTCVTLMFDFGREMISQKNTYFSVAFHCLDQGTDIQAAMEYHRQWKKGSDSLKSGPGEVHVKWWFIMSVGILVSHRLLSTIAVWLVSHNLLNTVLQMFDLAMVKAVYDGHVSKRREPSLIQRFLQWLEAVFESFPQLILTMVFLLKTNTVNPVFVIQAVFSLFTLTSRICTNDREFFSTMKWRRPQFKFTQCPPCNKQWFFRVFWFRFSELSSRVCIISILWATIGGTWLFFTVCLEFICGKLALYYFEVYLVNKLENERKLQEIQQSGSNLNDMERLNSQSSDALVVANESVNAYYSSSKSEKMMKRQAQMFDIYSVDFYSSILHLQLGMDTVNIKALFIRGLLELVILFVVVLFAFVKGINGSRVPPFEERNDVMSAPLGLTCFIWYILGRILTYYCVLRLNEEIDLNISTTSKKAADLIGACIKKKDWKQLKDLILFSDFAYTKHLMLSGSQVHSIRDVCDMINDGIYIVADDWLKESKFNGVSLNAEKEDEYCECLNPMRSFCGCEKSEEDDTSDLRSSFAGTLRKSAMGGILANQAKHGFLREFEENPEWEIFVINVDQYWNYSKEHLKEFTDGDLLHCILDCYCAIKETLKLETERSRSVSATGQRNRLWSIANVISTAVSFYDSNIGNQTMISYDTSSPPLTQVIDKYPKHLMAMTAKCFIRGRSWELLSSVYGLNEEFDEIIDKALSIGTLHRMTQGLGNSKIAFEWLRKAVKKEGELSINIIGSELDLFLKDLLERFLIGDKQMKATSLVKHGFADYISKEKDLKSDVYGKQSGSEATVAPQWNQMPALKSTGSNEEANVSVSVVVSDGFDTMDEKSDLTDKPLVPKTDLVQGTYLQLHISNYKVFYAVLDISVNCLNDTMGLVERHEFSVLKTAMTCFVNGKVRNLNALSVMSERSCILRDCIAFQMNLGELCLNTRLTKMPTLVKIWISESMAEKQRKMESKSLESIADVEMVDKKEEKEDSLIQFGDLAMELASVYVKCEFLPVIDFRHKLIGEYLGMSNGVECTNVVKKYEALHAIIDLCVHFDNEEFCDKVYETHSLQLLRAVIASIAIEKNWKILCLLVKYSKGFTQLIIEHFKVSIVCSETRSQKRVEISNAWIMAANGFTLDAMSANELTFSFMQRTWMAPVEFEPINRVPDGFTKYDVYYALLDICHKTDDDVFSSVNAKEIFAQLVERHAIDVLRIVCSAIVSWSLKLRLSKYSDLFCDLIAETLTIGKMYNRMDTSDSSTPYLMRAVWLNRVLTGVNSEKLSEELSSKFDDLDPRLRPILVDMDLGAKTVQDKYELFSTLIDVSFNYKNMEPVYRRHEESVVARVLEGIKIPLFEPGLDGGFVE